MDPTVCGYGTGNSRGREAVRVEEIWIRLPKNRGYAGSQLVERESFTIVAAGLPREQRDFAIAQCFCERAIARSCNGDVKSGGGDGRKRSEHRAFAAEKRWIFAEDEESLRHVLGLILPQHCSRPCYGQS